MLYSFKPLRHIHTVVIGAGPTGLAASYLLKEQGIQHVVLEQSNVVASHWHHLWDNYQLAMPADKVEMPGVDVGKLFGEKKHPSRDEMIRFFKWYADRFALPVCYQNKVENVRHSGDGKFIVTTNQFSYNCENVISCIGPRQTPKWPEAAIKLKDRGHPFILHSSEYRSSAVFPSGRVLVVGSGASALSIAMDIHNQGLFVDIACAYSQEDIVSRNQHLYEASTTDVVPTLNGLLKRNIKNEGRLLNVLNNDLLFKKDDKLQLIPVQSYGAIVFATGFDRSLKVLDELLSGLSVYGPAQQNGVSDIPGLYIAGQPHQDQETVIISDGTRQAREIVAKITQETQCQEMVARPSRLVAKL
ncbi:MAG: NAD(P)-binding domain-containing protein [Candidatus Berkiella sp.]